jgi:transcriptional regulator NrdR family protein
MKCPTCGNPSMDVFPIRNSWGTGIVEAVYRYCQTCGEFLTEEREATT